MTSSDDLKKAEKLAELKSVITNNIAALRKSIDDPVCISYSHNISFEICPESHGDRFTTRRKGWGNTCTNYTNSGLSLDVYREDDFVGIHRKEFKAKELSIPDLQEKLAEENIERFRILKLIGYNIQEITAHSGRWVWINYALKTCANFYNSESEAIASAWNDAGVRAFAAPECSWAGTPFKQQRELLVRIFSTGNGQASLPV